MDFVFDSTSTSNRSRTYYSTESDRFTFSKCAVLPYNIRYVSRRIEIGDGGGGGLPKGMRLRSSRIFFLFFYYFCSSLTICICSTLWYESGPHSMWRIVCEVMVRPIDEWKWRGNGSKVKWKLTFFSAPTLDDEERRVQIEKKYTNGKMWVKKKARLLEPSNGWQKSILHSE